MPDPVISVPDAELNDLRTRLRNTRWPKPWPGTGWAAGTDTPALHHLTDRWADAYDWREQEKQINGLPWQHADIGGTPVTYLLFPAETPDALPLVLTNGWPSSFLELTALARRLATPSGHGSDPHDAFTVVVPVLPGFPLGPARPTVPADLPTHEIWHRLMRDHLGYGRYAAHGGDLGAGTTTRLAAHHPDELAGIHLMALADPAEVDPATITQAEQDYLDQVATWHADEGAYEHQQATRPMSLAPALSDSPVGLLAWIVEKYQAWSDCGGELARRFDDDFLLTQASLYWFTNSIGTSLRPYWEQGRDEVPTPRRVEVPTAVALFPADLAHPPRSWAERTYTVTRYTQMPRGGHFAPHEEPALLAADITEFLRPLR